MTSKPTPFEFATPREIVFDTVTIRVAAATKRFAGIVAVICEEDSKAVVKDVLPTFTTEVELKPVPDTMTGTAGLTWRALEGERELIVGTELSGVGGEP